MVDAIEGIRAKLARALEHLLELDEKVDLYLHKHPLRLRREITPDGLTQFFVLREMPPPIELPVLVGEVVHQLRSAVEHIAHGLVVASGAQPTRSTVFPVLVERSRALKVHGGVTATALTMVDAVQPYQCSVPMTHPLYVLDRMWNIDKHRTLHVTTASLSNSQIFMASPDGNALLGGQFQTSVLRDGSVIGVFSFNEAPDPDCEIEASAQTFLALADEGPWQSDVHVTLLLDRLYDYLTLSLVPDFEPLL